MQRRKIFKGWDTVHDIVLFGWRICTGSLSGRKTRFLSERDGSGTGLGEESQINGNDGLWGKWLVCNAGGAVSGLSHLPIEGFYFWAEFCVNLLLEKNKILRRNWGERDCSSLKEEVFMPEEFFIDSQTLTVRCGFLVGSEVNDGYLSEWLHRIVVTTVISTQTCGKRRVQSEPGWDVQNGSLWSSAAWCSSWQLYRVLTVRLFFFSKYHKSFVTSSESCCSWVYVFFFVLFYAVDVWNRQHFWELR